MVSANGEISKIDWYGPLKPVLIGRFSNNLTCFFSISHTECVCVAKRSAHTFILLCKVVCHFPVLVAVQDTVGYVEVICCHLVDTLGNANERG